MYTADTLRFGFLMCVRRGLFLAEPIHQERRHLSVWNHKPTHDHPEDRRGRVSVILSKLTQPVTKTNCQPKMKLFAPVGIGLVRLQLLSHGMQFEIGVRELAPRHARPSELD